MEPSDSDKQRADRAARNEALFRRVNERLEELTEGLHTDEAQFVCECASIDCAERIELPLREYEAVRGVATQFFIKPDHLLPHDERVVERHDHYVVVEKVGHASERARELDPRSE
jgi:hypothetical protein